MTVVAMMTKMSMAYISFGSMPLTLPISANMSPTSPLGIMEIPMRALFLAQLWMIKNAPMNLVMNAIETKESPMIQNETDEKSMTRRCIERPTITKKMGVNIWMIGVMFFLTSSSSNSFVLKNAPKGRKNLRESATPAAKEPSIAGAPTRCERYAKSRISEMMMVGM